MRYDLTQNKGGVHRLPSVDQRGVDSEAVNALVAIAAANLAAASKPQPQKEHHYHGNSVGIFGGLLMLTGFVTVAFVAYSGFKGQMPSDSLQRFEYTATKKVGEVQDKIMDSVTPDFVQTVGAWFSDDEPELTAKDSQGNIIKVGDKIISSYQKQLTVLSIENHAGKTVVKLSDDHPEDTRPRLLFGQEQINEHKYIKLEGAE